MVYKPFSLTKPLVINSFPNQFLLDPGLTDPVLLTTGASRSPDGVIHSKSTY